MQQGAVPFVIKDIISISRETCMWSEKFIIANVYFSGFDGCVVKNVFGVRNTH